MKIKDTSDQDIVIAQPKNKTKTITSIAITIVVIATIIWQIAPAASKWSQASHSISAERVRTAIVTRGDFTRDISVLGRVVAAVSPTVYSPADGTITLLIEAGHQVKENQAIATLESPELTSRLFQQQAILDSLKSSYERQKIQAKKQHLIDQKSVDLANVRLVSAKREKRRADLGYEKNAINQIDFEKAQDELKNAQLQHRHAEQDAALNIESLDFDGKSLQLDIKRQALLVSELERQVEGLTIRSPVSGIVGNLNTDNKTFLSKNQAILTVVDLSNLEVEIDIPESYADDLVIGMDVNVQFEQKQFSARLVTISPEILNNQVTGRVRFSKETPQQLRQNQRLNTQIILEYKSDVLQIQRGQFMESSGGRFAYLINDGLATKTPISLGARSLSHVEVLNGLTEGQRIIISGTDMFNAAEQVLLNN
ncbi:efflux RND transporter periplasmic adaptor subunit [Litorilituus lipolyticus]|uniref:HlyD family efflux transporter periplasmic adaptor subunit n=1 Tax=Litorilituus lipolyticus TaxID=2491017 RepID=A0A502KUN2_9GAMM|nr:HlyD family efflux transporter periplasmic adaptor subunit [Litorilituus lipolyticus]TPH13925.1 HlyD family efflux transporter periplasmic adaptor subunit [Litorilituus lipolyticus]